jgi:hypothetical protein
MQTVLIILQLIPALIKVIQAVEEALPQAGIGSEKLAAIRQMLEVTYAGVKEVWPILEKVIAILVDLFNKTGVFEKK